MIVRSSQRPVEAAFCFCLNDHSFLSGGTTSWQTRQPPSALKEVAERIRGCAWSAAYSVRKVGGPDRRTLGGIPDLRVRPIDLPFSFIHKCALAFDVEMMELLEGSSPRLTGYTVTPPRRGTDHRHGARNRDPLHRPAVQGPHGRPLMGPLFLLRGRCSAPIHQNTTTVRTFDLVLEGRLKSRSRAHRDPGPRRTASSTNPRRPTA